MSAESTLANLLYGLPVSSRAAAELAPGMTAEAVRKAVIRRNGKPVRRGQRPLYAADDILLALFHVEDPERWRREQFKLRVATGVDDETEETTEDAA